VSAQLQVTAHFLGNRWRQRHHSGLVKLGGLDAEEGFVLIEIEQPESHQLATPQTATKQDHQDQADRLAPQRIGAGGGQVLCGGKHAGHLRGAHQARRRIGNAFGERDEVRDVGPRMAVLMKKKKVPDDKQAIAATGGGEFVQTVGPAVKHLGKNATRSAVMSENEIVPLP